MKQQETVNEIPKYHKFTGSDISKSKAKSKHKHQYEECLTQYKFDFNGKTSIHTILSSYCSICGKIGDTLKNGECNKELNIISKDKKVNYITCIYQMKKYMKDSIIDCRYSL